MNPTLISAFSALAGAVIGGLMSLLASWVANHQQIRSQWLAHARSHREDLYKEFIEEAAKCYIDALLRDRPDIPSLVVLYAKMSRMRVVSSHRVIESAEQLIRKILNTYSAPAVTELQVIKFEMLDIVRDFSETCRAEFDNLHP